MSKRSTKIKSLAHTPRHSAIMIGLALLAVPLLALAITYFATPKRSVASYCNTYRSEKVRLEKQPGNTYPSGVFNETLSDAGEFALSYGKLEKVAPDEIRPDVATLQSLYKKIDEDPSQSIAAAISGVSVDESVKNWTTDHCKE